ncbi:hypothetical protein H6A09_01375 [[Clostridium] spiroforme]|nr:hypothetical protein [Thomasclavelia spiroformis]
MLNCDKYALECDLAEVYHIYDIKELPLRKVALFSAGLRDDSRIKMKMNDMIYPFEKLVIADIADKLALMIWQRGGAKESNRPELMLPKLLGIEKKDNDVISFSSKEDFEKRRKEIMRGD